MSKVPAFVQGIPDDVERFRSMTTERRLALLFELCDLTDSIVNARPDPDALRRGNERSPEAWALWRRLMNQNE